MPKLDEIKSKLATTLNTRVVLLITPYLYKILSNELGKGESLKKDVLTLNGKSFKVFVFDDEQLESNGGYEVYRNTCIEDYPPESVSQRQAILYYMDVLKCKTFLQLSRLLSYPTSKLINVANHDFYIDGDLANKLQHATNKGSWWFRKLSRPSIPEGEKINDEYER